MTDWRSVPVFGDKPVGVHEIVRPSAYGIMSDGRRCIAAVRTPLGYFLPGGGQHDAESVEGTVAREVVEECGLVVQVGTWRAAAVDHVWSIEEHTHFEKRSTFCDAIVVGDAGDSSEADHELLWMSMSDAVAALTPPSHRWAVGEWE